jgi:RimJ/RimL family protein N-acetyltransferase
VKHGYLPDGTQAIARPIRHDDDVALRAGLKRLSPEGQFYRFLQYREDFTEQELHYLTHCDMVDHYAMILAILDGAGNEIDRVGVARYVRDKEEPELAEVAIVLVDEWQRRGGGSFLATALAAEAWKRDVRRWQAFTMSDNAGIQKLLDLVGRKLGERRLGHGTLELTYELFPPGFPLGILPG